MNITRARAVAVLIAIRFKTADKWEDDRIAKKLSGVNETVVKDDMKTIEDADVLADLKAVLAANEKGDPITVESPTEEKEKPAAKEEKSEKSEKPAKAEKSEKSAKAEKTPKAEKKEAAVDKFGNREGSQAAKINAQLKKSYTSEEDIAKGAGVTVARVRGHLKWLISNKKAESGEKGYRLV